MADLAARGVHIDPEKPLSVIHNVRPSTLAETGLRPETHLRPFRDYDCNLGRWSPTVRGYASDIQVKSATLRHESKGETHLSFRAYPIVDPESLLVKWRSGMRPAVDALKERGLPAREGGARHRKSSWDGATVSRLCRSKDTSLGVKKADEKCAAAP